jgi:hypothetical protein
VCIGQNLLNKGKRDIWVKEFGFSGYNTCLAACATEGTSSDKKGRVRVVIKVKFVSLRAISQKERCRGNL